MKIHPNKVKVTPKDLPFALCVFGEPDEEVATWIQHHSLKTEKSGKFTNINIDGKNVYDLFEEPKKYKYIDAFSPNLNKHLHLGHLSNLIIAKALYSFNIGWMYIAILGDTLDGSVEKEDALNMYKKYCTDYGYVVNNIYYASKQVLQNTELLTDGTGDFAGTKIFEVDEEKIVGIKSSGSTTYFYQDVALAEHLFSQYNDVINNLTGKPYDNNILYITGFEQNQHFATLKKIYPSVEHIGLGLVMIDGKKMSSSEGNVIMASEILSTIESEFNNDKNLAWNVLAGQILKYDLPSIKNINMKDIKNYKTSQGLYISYTMARLKSAGLELKRACSFNDKNLEFMSYKARYFKSPNLLFNAVVIHCEKINNLYGKVRIKDNPEGAELFSPMFSDLALGMKHLGLFEVESV